MSGVYCMVIFWMDFQSVGGGGLKESIVWKGRGSLLHELGGEALNALQSMKVWCIEALNALQSCLKKVKNSKMSFESPYIVNTW